MTVISIKTIGKSGSTDLVIADVAVDTVAELPNPSTAIADSKMVQFSKTLITQTGEIYVLNSLDEWKSSGGEPVI